MSDIIVDTKELGAIIQKHVEALVVYVNGRCGNDNEPDWEAAEGTIYRLKELIDYMHRDTSNEQ